MKQNTSDEYFKPYFNNGNGYEHLNLGPVGIDYCNGAMEKVMLKTSNARWNREGNGAVFIPRAEKILAQRERLPTTWNETHIGELIETGKTSLTKPFENSVLDVLDKVLQYINS